MGEAAAWVPDPDGRRHVWGVAGKPNCSRLVGRSRLPSDRLRREGHSGARASGDRTVHHAGKKFGDRVGDGPVDDLGALLFGHGESFLIPVADFKDASRLAVHAVGGESGIRIGHCQGSDLGNPESECGNAGKFVTAAGVNPHRLGDLRDAADACSFFDCHEIGVCGERGCLRHGQEATRGGVVDGHGGEGNTGVAVNEAFERCWARRVDRLVGGDPSLEGSGQREDLEGRPGLHADGAAHGAIRVVVVGGFADARRTPRSVLRHGDDVSGPGLHHRNGCRLAAVVVRWDELVDGVGSGPVDLRVEGGADGVATAPEKGLSLLRGLAECLVGQDRLQNVVAEEGGVRRRASVGGPGWVEHVLHRYRRRPRGLLG